MMDTVLLLHVHVQHFTLSFFDVAQHDVQRSVLPFLQFSVVSFRHFILRWLSIDFVVCARSVVDEH